MKKFKLIPFLFTFLGLFFGQVMAFDGGRAFGKEYIDYETFIHLNSHDQKEVVLMVMEFVSATDSVTKKEPAIFQKNKRSAEVLQKIWNKIIIESVYAKGETGIDTESLCIYGGWISIMVNNKCTHPHNLAGVHKGLVEKLSEPTKKKVLKASEEYQVNLKKVPDCKSPEMVVCAPTFFGTETKDSKPFCVDGNKGKVSVYGVNTSLQCMKEVKDKPDVLQKIVDNALSNDESRIAFTETLKLMYSTCMCKDGDYINQGYTNRIFDHRTCYGIIMQSQNVLDKMFNADNKANACTELRKDTYANGLATMADFAIDAYKNISNRFNTKAYIDIMELSNDKVDAEFASNREEDRKKYVEAGTCPIDFPGVDLIAEPDKDNPGVYIITAKLKGLKAQEKVSDLKWVTPENPVFANENSPLIIKVKQIEKEEIPIKASFFSGIGTAIVPPLSDGPKLAIKGTQDKAKKLENLKAVLTGVEIDPAIKFEWALKDASIGKVPSPSEDSSEATAEILETPYSVIVTYTSKDKTLTAEHEVKPLTEVCTIARKEVQKVEGEEEKETNKATFVLTTEKEKPTWTPQPDVLTEDMKEVTYSDYKDEEVKVTFEDGQSCTYTKEVKPEEPANPLEGMKLSISIANTTNEKSDIDAKLEKDGKDITDEIPPGHEIVWFVTESGKTPTIADKKEEKKDEVKTDDESKREPSSESKHGIGKSTEVYRDTNSDKTVKAKLMKGDEVVLESNTIQVDKNAKKIQQNLNNTPNLPGAIQPNLFRKGLGGQRGVF